MTKTDLPPRLSDEQQFVLAYLADHKRGIEESFREHRRRMRRRGYPPGTTSMAPERSWVLSRAVAREFDDGGDRIEQKPPERTRTERAADALANGNDQLAELILRSPGRPGNVKTKAETLTPTHRSSFSTTIT